MTDTPASSATCARVTRFEPASTTVSVARVCIVTQMAARMTVPAFVAFAAFGSFWGVWGASVPRVQHQAGVGDGRLGVALLFVGAGALPAMLLAGRALDRWGLRVAG